MECLRCAKCCFEPFYRHVRPDDVEEWKANGRQDLVEILEREIKAQDRTNMALAALGMPFHTCRFCRPEGPGKFYCEIYQYRPITCREFDPGCSRLCPQYQGRKKIIRPVEFC